MVNNILKRARAEANKMKEDHTLFKYTDMEYPPRVECRNKNWAKWVNIKLPLTPELRKNINSHPELRALHKLFKKPNNDGPQSLRSTSSNLVALCTTGRPRTYEIGSVLFTPDNMLEVEWKYYQGSDLRGVPRAEKSKKDQEIRRLKRKLEKEQKKVDGLKLKLKEKSKALVNLLAHGNAEGEYEEPAEELDDDEEEQMEDLEDDGEEQMEDLDNEEEEQIEDSDHDEDGEEQGEENDRDDEDLDNEEQMEREEQNDGDDEDIEDGEDQAGGNDRDDVDEMDVEDVADEDEDNMVNGHARIGEMDLMD